MAFSKFLNFFLGLIAEYIRRHHYRESVQVLCHFMPIRAEDDSVTDDESDDNENTLEIPEDISLPNEVEQQQEDHEGLHLRLLQFLPFGTFKKYFVLSHIRYID